MGKAPVNRKNDVKLCRRCKKRPTSRGLCPACRQELAEFKQKMEVRAAQQAAVEAKAAEAVAQAAIKFKPSE